MISEFVQAWEGFIFFVFIISIPLGMFLLWAGLKSVKFEKITLWNLIGVAFLVFLITYAVTIFLAALLSFPTPMAYVFGLLLSFLPAKFLLKLKGKDYLVIWGMSCLGQILSLLIASQLLVGGISYLFKII